MNSDAVRRLLGPDRRPLSCDECFAEFDRYVEYRLAAPAATFELCSVCKQPKDCARASDCLGMGAHLESCPACEEEYASLRDLVLAERGGQPWDPERAR